MVTGRTLFRPASLVQIDQALLRRIAPENPRPGVLRPHSREPYVDYSDSQLPDDNGAVPASLAVGAKVYHQTFGRGVISGVKGAAMRPRCGLHLSGVG